MEHEKRRTLSHELNIQKEKSKYDDQLAKDRIEYRLRRGKEFIMRIRHYKRNLSRSKRQ
jgi:hypothetical protein